MNTGDQGDVIAFLSSRTTHGGAAVERIETHASMVFLAGTRAWKLKRAVRYDYLDFSTITRRQAMCEAELRLNVRTAPTLYHRVVPITREANGSLLLGGGGEPIDWVIEMTRFDQEDLLDRHAALGTLRLDLMRPLATALARFHKASAVRLDHGGASGMAWVIDGNALGFGQYGPGILDDDAAAALTRDARAELQRHHTLLDQRRERGCVRQCHGDLHLRNIVLLDGEPTLFDAVEFNDEIACIDVLYDLAFLLMDLWRRRLPHHANALLNGYLFETLDLEGLPLLPLFLSCRAAVRAKTSASAASLQSDSLRKHELEELAQGYLSLARQLLASSGTCLVAIGGLSGSGKTTLARAIAPAIGRVPGAIIIRSDEVRKQLCGVDALHRLGADAYSAEMTTRVYDEVAARARRAVRGGQVAIVDAVYAHAADREAIEHIAQAMDVPFAGLWLEAPSSELMARAQQRQRDASDADAEVIRRQLADFTRPASWRRLDASRAVRDVADDALSALHDAAPRLVRPVGPGPLEGAGGDYAAWAGDGV
jgi:aminoglycoside phosphotransferase family enzyme/predicted kinase